MSTLLQIKKLTKSFGPNIILNEASFVVSDKQKIGVIGRNGAGKSTLFKIIIGLEEKDSGDVVSFNHTRIGYLKQEDDFLEGDTVLSYLIRESKKEEWECCIIASQFELKNDLLDSKIVDLSGGYQMRVKLSLMLLFEPNLLLLDEPTNYLDLSTMFLLENFLKKYNGSYLIISHDRRFIKNTCKEILDVENGKAIYYNGGLEEYLKFKQEKLVFSEKYNKKQEAKKKHLQKFINRFGAKASLATQAKSKEKQIARIKTIDIENSLSTVTINIPNSLARKGFVLRAKKMAIGYDKNQVAGDITFEIEKGEHWAVLGDNGQGKSTFLKTIAQEISLLVGELYWADNLKIAYYAQHVIGNLNPKENVESFLESSAGINYSTEEIYKMAGDFLFSKGDIKKSISVLSGGEKARLCLAGMLLRKNDVLLLDEPTNHLDFETAEALAFALAKSNATIFFVSHDRTFTNIVADNILEVDNGSIKRFFGDYDDYIYHLKKKTGLIKEAKKKIEQNPALKKINKKEERVKKIEKQKILRKKMLKIEKEREQLRMERESILTKFASNPINSSIKLRKRFKEIDKFMLILEDKWLELDKKLEDCNF